jgi:hypothetical protein
MHPIPVNENVTTTQITRNAPLASTTTIPVFRTVTSKLARIHHRTIPISHSQNARIPRTTAHSHARIISKISQLLICQRSLGSSPS